MYPTLVIVLAETQRSMTDICEVGPSSASRLAGPVPSDHEARTATLVQLSSAVGPTNSAVDDEAESPLFHALQSRDVQEYGLEKVILEVNFEKSRVSSSG